ncbi:MULTISPECIES: helix-turn-helix domain-containing protein [Streptomyces]|uniref:Helix-turn-helix domain-containing protein n=1 Tax=Streptomyces griseosporeus TaxID=1910 RepID=A0ABV3KGZ4_STRGS|nr:helix-turn-helix domain-containing protein [Streptomyces actuosus]
MTLAAVDQFLTVPEPLASWVSGARRVSLPDASEDALVHLPDAAARLVVRVGPRGERDVLAVGPRVRAAYYRGRSRVSCVELRLAPGTVRPLLGVPAAELVGRAVRLESLPTRAAHRLARELRWTGPEETVARAAEVLPELMAEAADPSRTALLRAGVEALSVRAGRTPGQVGEVARELAVSERQLRNLFTEGVGVSPKHYARIDRVRAVVDRAPTAPWAELAAATGYYDQSHMTTDFRALMGVPPRSYFTGRLPADSPCQLSARA